ncbi:hypothetical protein BUZ97_12170 [Mammaliicoccus sciuri]|nr:hypothetical protein BUZ97_12170 [Mammaliicoccus sciuri]
MKSLYFWIKWKNYIRWKDKWQTFFLNSDHNKYIGFITVLLDSILAIFNTVTYYFIFRLVLLNKEITNNDVSSPILKMFFQSLIKFQNGPEYLWNLYWLIFMIFCIYIGIKSSQWSYFSTERTILNSYIGIPENKTNVYLFLESIVWNTRIFIFSILSLCCSILLVLNSSLLDYILYLSTSIILYLGLTLMISCIHNIFTLYQMHMVYPSLYLSRIIIFKLIIIIIGVVSSNYIYTWILKAPFFRSDFSSTLLNNWYLLGWNKLEGLIFFPITYEYLPNVLLQRTLKENNLILLFFIVPLMILTISILYLFLQKIKNNVNFKTNKYVMLPYLESLHKYTIFKLNFLSHKYSYFKMFYRSPIVLKNIKSLIGGSLSWFIVGVMVGVLYYMKLPVEGVLIIFSFAISYCVFFNSETFFSTFKGAISLDAEGKLILLYFYDKKNKWLLLKNKWLISFIYTFKFILIMDLLILIFSNFKITLFIFMVLCQIIVTLFFNILLFLPSVIAPHFDFINFEQLEDYSDRNLLEAVIKSLVYIVLLPLLMLPSILVISNIINETKFYILIICLMSVLILVTLIILQTFKIYLFKKNYVR